MTRTNLPVSLSVVDLDAPLDGESDHSARVMQSYMIGFYLAVNAISDVYALVEGPDCVHVKTQFVQGNHDWLSTLTSVSGVHRIANTALHPVTLAASREPELMRLLARMGRHPAVEAVLYTSMPMAFITGADYERVCRETSEATGKPILHVKGNSLSHDWMDGYAETLIALAKQLDLSGGSPDPDKVAIVGHLFERNEADARANVSELRRLLGALGLEVTSIWLEGGRFRDLARVRDAGTILSFPYGRKAAQLVARRTGAKLVQCELPFGPPATERFLRQLGSHFGREAEVEALIDRELSEVVPALEWVVPFVFQDRRWGFVGDPHLAAGLREIADLLGSKLSFAVITNPEHQTRGLDETFRKTVETLIFPRTRTYGRFAAQAIARHEVSLVVTNSIMSLPISVATVELGFPSFYTHALFERPSLGFRGFLAFADSMANAIRQHELREAQRPAGSNHG